MKTSIVGIWISGKIWSYKDLTVMEKLFLVKITGLDREKGCYASNKYFSEFFGLSRSRCSFIINSLKKKGYIAIRYAYEGTTNIVEKRIIKVKNIVAKAVKVAKKYIKRVDVNKLLVKSYNTDSVDEEVEIECLELTGAKRRMYSEITNNDYTNSYDEIDEKSQEENICVENKVEEITVKTIIEREEVEDIDTITKNIKDENIKDIKENNNDDVKRENFICKSQNEEVIVQLDIFGSEKSEGDNNKGNKSSGGYKGNEICNKNVELKKKQNKDPKNNKIIYEEIINYLNLKCTKSFKISTVKTLKHINARLREGNTVDDFKTVIDKKYAQWINTSMEKYLRPETLFGTKFERYLNEKVLNSYNNIKCMNYGGDYGYGKQFKNARNNRENKQTKESTKFGITTPLTKEEIERAQREIF